MVSTSRRAAVTVVATVAGMLALSGCGAVDPDAPARVATRFTAAAGAPTTACALLAPQTKKELEADGQPCTQALPEAKLPAAGHVVRTTVAGHSAQVVMEHDTLFLAQFDDGWKVTAAGCTREEPGDDRVPYDCTVKG